MADVLEDSRDKVQENLLANGGNHSVVPLFTKLQASRSFVCKAFVNINSDSWSVFTVDLVTYITRFQWDMAKYPIKQSLKNISEIVSKVYVACLHRNTMHSSTICPASLLIIDILSGRLFWF